MPLKEAPKWFGVSQDTIYQQRKRGKIKIYKAGRRSVLNVSEVQKWIDDTYYGG
ncbi:helix-turn-helix transcriptional regulator [Pseudopelagicola sp. nBUS_20]|uniref:helix-turn-helix transcriptional regulator n=1 Tax=Pseudopelagicola sp. nBUS_20 TaxID=3395317 RepID=UPI003EBBEC93